MTTHGEQVAGYDQVQSETTRAPPSALYASAHSPVAAGMALWTCARLRLWPA